MRRLLLVRHAKSRWDQPDVADHDRPLSPRGRRAAPLSASTSRASPNLPTSCCARRRRGPWKRCSGYVRPCHQHIAIEVDERLYAADADVLLDHVRQVSVTVTCVLLIGHNPGIGDLAVMLAGHGDRGARAAMAAKFPTAALALLAIDSGGLPSKLAPPPSTSSGPHAEPGGAVAGDRCEAVPQRLDDLRVDDVAVGVDASGPSGSR